MLFTLCKTPPNVRSCRRCRRSQYLLSYLCPSKKSVKTKNFRSPLWRVKNYNFHLTRFCSFWKITPSAPWKLCEHSVQENAKRALISGCNTWAHFLTEGQWLTFCSRFNGHVTCNLKSSSASVAKVAQSRYKWHSLQHRRESWSNNTPTWYDWHLWMRKPGTWHADVDDTDYIIALTAPMYFIPTINKSTAMMSRLATDVILLYPLCAAMLFSSCNWWCDWWWQRCRRWRQHVL